MKYKVCSYELQDGRWGPAFVPSQGPDIYSEPTEFNIYFPSKKEADDYVLNYLMNEEKVEIKNIEII